MTIQNATSKKQQNNNIVLGTQLGHTDEQKKTHKNTRDTVGLSVVIGASSSGGVEAKWTPLFLVGDRSVGWGVRHMRKQLLASKREQTNNGTGTPKKRRRLTGLPTVVWAETGSSGGNQRR